MSGYSIFVQLHVSAGAVALATFWLAASLRKGSPRHRLVGRIYLLAMLGVIASGVPLTVDRLLAGNMVGAAFLAYLLLLVSTTVWLSWRAIRDRNAPQRYLGRAYHALAVGNMLAGAGILALGLGKGQPLLMGFSLVGMLLGIDMWRRRRVIPHEPRWWMAEHYGAMVGNGAATHIAFMAIGLPRLLPQANGHVLFYLAWFAPVALAFAARVWLDRRYRVATTTPSSVSIAPAHVRQ